MMSNRKYLKENKMDEVKQEVRAVEPEEVISWLNYRSTFHHLSSFLKP